MEISGHQSPLHGRGEGTEPGEGTARGGSSGLPGIKASVLAWLEGPAGGRHVTDTSHREQ